MTATLQRVIIIRNQYHTKWYCVRDPIYCHLEMDRRGEMSDRDSDPTPFVQNSYIPETQQYLNYYGSQCYYEEPQALPQYYYFPQSQPQGPQVEGAGASMRNINSRNKVPVASESTAESNEGAETSGKRKSTKYVKEQGDKLTNVLGEMQKSQVEQMKMMSQFMGAMVEAMKNAKN